VSASAPTAEILQHPEPRRGRPTELDREARTLAGRVGEMAEGHAYDISAHCVYARGNDERYWHHDARLDALNEDNKTIAAKLIAHPDEAVQAAGWLLLANCREYDRVDALEDSEHAQHHGHSEQSHVHARAIAGGVELLLSGRARGRAARRATVAVQGTLPEGVE
jgi:hypothetical protein